MLDHEESYTGVLWSNRLQKHGAELGVTAFHGLEMYNLELGVLGSALENHISYGVKKVKPFLEML